MARPGRKKKASCQQRHPELDERRVWRPGVDPLDEGEELQYEPSAYDTIHAFRLGWPCLSFDILRDELGALRHEFPLTLFCTAGTQAANPADNRLIVAKLTNISGKKRGVELAASDDGDSSSSSSDESDDEEMRDKTPKLEVRMIAHHGCINRIRAMPQEPNIIATWSETGLVQIWDVKSLLQELSSVNAGSSSRVTHQAPLQVFSGHEVEGFALDWSLAHQGWLASGDNNGVIHVWQPNRREWIVGGRTLVGHSSSVEDLQASFHLHFWCPTLDPFRLASCSSDGTLRLWDVPTCTCTAMWKIHDADVNVISWRSDSVLASGGDDGIIYLWNLKHLKDGPISMTNYHSAPITSIEWSPHDSSMLAATSADNQLSVWDFSVEADPEEEAQVKQSVAAPKGLPESLLFVHQGQRDLKELHWHPQLLGTIVSTSFSDFNVFKPSNL
ncbi:hypothetical protein SELMODRAFT_123562 [Selaginella moellendorffii]|uniref:Glutamate-rich WD repeat-containing protein 1 n=1 Tax=Selaginella moellendorffii TaxID=88036 RepID=D8SS68_SELML|nr:hypothetical protein SELMODRAFT_123562 [Selaginella moellendorffii]